VFSSAFLSSSKSFNQSLSTRGVWRLTTKGFC